MTFKESILALMVGFLFISCKDGSDSNILPNEEVTSKWNIENLSKKAKEHLDSSTWDMITLKQDIELFYKYPEVLKSYPITKSPFPISEYEYAVSSIPFIMEKDGKILKGVRIGEFENFESEKAVDKLALIILTNDRESEESTLVESRNFPYLTAQGYFKAAKDEYEWVFTSSPDGFSTLLINMKLFDLRFGETIVIYPQKDKSFYYDQLKETTNNYPNFDEYTLAILTNKRVITQINSKNNIE